MNVISQITAAFTGISVFALAVKRLALAMMLLYVWYTVFFSGVFSLIDGGVYLTGSMLLSTDGVNLFKVFFNPVWFLSLIWLLSLSFNCLLFVMTMRLYRFLSQQILKGV